MAASYPSPSSSGSDPARGIPQVIEVADTGAELQDRVRGAAESRTPLSIESGGTKSFLGRLTQAEAFDVSRHCGIVDYQPTELVVTARGGTRLSYLDEALAEEGQMLAFEPPHFGPEATIGGTIACGLSGPGRPYAGAARDHVLGVKLLNGKGEVLSFGGQVMKNVAGYDLSRLMAGAMGTLGVLLEVSLKVLPRPAVNATLAFESNPREALERMNGWAGEPLPISGACHEEGRLYIRLSGTAGGVSTAMERLGGDRTGEVFHSLGPGLLSLHKRLKSAFDPQGVFNPGRLYAGL